MSEDTKSVRLSVNMSPETAEALKEVAESRGISTTEAIRRAVALTNFFERERQAGHRIESIDPESKTVREIVLL